MTVVSNLNSDEGHRFIGVRTISYCLFATS